MKKSFITIAAFLMLPYTSMISQPAAPDSAKHILKTALQDAITSDRNVLILFHATWCKWCKRLDTALESPEIKKIIDKNFAVVKLDVLERGDKIQTHENPDGKEMLNKFGGENSGLPFLVFLDASCKKIANSNVMSNNQNIGYPAAREEIFAFTNLLKKSAPRINKKQLAIISDYLTRNAPKQ